MEEGRIFGTGASPYDGHGESRIDDLGVRSDRAPEPGSVWSTELQTPFVQLTNAVMFDLLHFLRLHGDEASRIAANHLANDVRATVEEASQLDGRGSARSARAVFEDAVVLSTLVREPVSRERFLAHGALETLRLFENGLGLELLGRKERKAEQSRTDKVLRRVRRDARKAKRTHAHIEKGWLQGSLYDKAVLLGWTDRYDHGYRVLSSAIHGSMAGILGNRRGVGEEAVYRWGGPALEWVPLALIELLRTLELLVDEADSRWPDFDSEFTRYWLGECKTSWPAVRAAVMEADRKFWPSNPTPADRSILGIFPKGERWYVENALVGAVAVAEPPQASDFPNLQWDQINAFVDEARRRRATGTNGRPVTLVVDGLTLKPKDGATWVPTASVLEPMDRPGAPALMRRTLRDPKDMV